MTTGRRKAMPRGGTCHQRRHFVLEGLPLAGALGEEPGPGPRGVKVAAGQRLLRAAVVRLDLDDGGVRRRLRAVPVGHGGSPFVFLWRFRTSGRSRELRAQPLSLIIRAPWLVPASLALHAMEHLPTASNTGSRCRTRYSTATRTSASAGMRAAVAIELAGDAAPSRRGALPHPNGAADRVAHGGRLSTAACGDGSSSTSSSSLAGSSGARDGAAVAAAAGVGGRALPRGAGGVRQLRPEHVLHEAPSSPWLPLPAVRARAAPARVARRARARGEGGGDGGRARRGGPVGARRRRLLRPRRRAAAARRRVRRRRAQALLADEGPPRASPCRRRAVQPAPEARPRRRCSRGSTPSRAAPTAPPAAPTPAVPMPPAPAEAARPGRRRP